MLALVDGGSTSGCEGLPLLDVAELTPAFDFGGLPRLRFGDCINVLSPASASVPSAGNVSVPGKGSHVVSSPIA